MSPMLGMTVLRFCCLQRQAFRQLVCAVAACLAIGAALAQSPASLVADDLVIQGTAFEFGEGVPKDELKAAALYCSAARLGNAVAMFNLGWMYANGRGIGRDDGVAALLFDMAAKQGVVQAQNMLHFVGAPTIVIPDCLRDHQVAEKTEEPGREPGGEQSWPIVSDSPEHKKIIELVFRLAPEYEVNPTLALAVLTTESGFDASARSPKNAQGLMQLIPETARRFNVSDSFDPVQNIRGGLAYLRWLLAYFKGDVALVAAGYNAGEGAVNKYRGIPPYRETQGYVKSILRLFKKNQHPYVASITEPSPVMSRIRASIAY